MSHRAKSHALARRSTSWLLCLWCLPLSGFGQGIDRSALYGTWRWVDTVGELLPARGTPQTCACVRLLMLEPGGFAAAKRRLNP
jgi:hypothetical protein